MKKLQAQKYLLLNKNNLAPKAKKKKKINCLVGNEMERTYRLAHALASYMSTWQKLVSLERVEPS